MHLPDFSLHNPKPAYILSLLKRAGLRQRAAAELLGVSERTMRYYVAEGRATHIPAPYTVQYALECLADAADAVREQSRVVAEAA